MSTKVIVTGGCGYIGSHTTVELIERGYEVVIIDDLSNSNMAVLDGIKQITGVKPLLEKVDLKEFDRTHSIFQKHKDATAVVHLAAFKAVGESMEKPLVYYQNNLYALINTLLCQSDMGIEKMIFSSSATVYGLPDNLPIVEQEPIKRPYSVYGNTKKIAEEILGDTVASNPQFSAISLRYFNPIGAHDSGLIGELPDGVPNNLMPLITQTAAGIRSELKVFGNDYNTRDGTPVRDYIHVMDLAEAHVKTLDYMMANKNAERWEVFNLGTGKGFSVLEIINTFEAISGKKIKYTFTNKREGDVPELYASSAHAEKKLKWKARRGLKEMIHSSWNWEKKLRGIESKDNL